MERESKARSLAASVILPTHGRRDSLLRVLHALARQTMPAGAFEVVVVCDGDIDGSAMTCRGMAAELPYALRVVEQPNAGPAAARNRGVAAARAPLVVFLDDDVVPDEGLLAAHLAAQEGQEQCVTIGPLLPPRDTRLNVWGAWEERTLCRQYDAMAAGLWKPTYRQFYTGNAAVPKRHIVAAGGFDPSFRRAEDVELALRLHERGLRFVFLPEARGWHYIRRGFAAWRRTPAAYGAADVEMARAGRSWMLTIVADEYGRRNRPSRVVSGLCAGRMIPVRALSVLLSALIRGADAFGIEWLGHMGCSILFNLLYYDGFIRAIGGRAAFVTLLGNQEAAAPSSSPLDHQDIVGAP